MAEKFKKGDVVNLKSGGPAMTITGKGRNCDHYVTWFNDDDELQYGEFDDEVLESCEFEEED